jgi:hypothetical protein
MSYLSWNGRGLGNPAAVRELRSIVKQFGPKIVFVMETKINKQRVEKLACRLGMCGGFAVSSDGLSGGIGIFWSADVVVDVKSFNLNHIDAIVTPMEGDLTPWRFTGFYGEPRRENRHLSWTLLRRLHLL